MLLVPTVPGVHQAGPAVHRVLQLVRQPDSARMRRRAQGRTRCHGLGGGAVRDDRRIAVGGSDRPRGAHPAHPRPADPQPRRRRRRGTAHRDPRRAGGAPTARGPTLGAIERAVAETGFSRFPVATRRRLSATCTSRMCWRSSTSPARCSDAVDGASAATGPGLDAAARCPVAAATQQQLTWHWSPTADGSVSAIVALEDLVEEFVGTVRDGTHRV